MKAAFQDVFLAWRAERGVHLELVWLAADCVARLHWLNCNERSYFDRLRFAKRRLDWLGGRLAAKAAVLNLLQWQTGPQQVEILPDATGQPVVRVSGAPRDAEPIGVTISHSGQIAAAAAYRRSQAGAVGLDVERLAPVEPALYQIAFTPEEIRYLEGSASPGERNTRVLRLWTAKEAVLKAIGRGLRASLQSVAVTPPAGEAGPARVTVADGTTRSFLARTALISDYVLCLAVAA
jgi:phosphopantetheinyl transferase